VIDFPSPGKLKRKRAEGDHRPEPREDGRDSALRIRLDDGAALAKAMGHDESYGALVEQQLRKEEGGLNEVNEVQPALSAPATPSLVKGVEGCSHIVPELIGKHLLYLITLARETNMSSTREDSSSLTPLQQKIESHFSLEILLKHRELRLIEQELAKCQVALEQLRRCQLIPYPSSTPTPTAMLNVSNGTGPALFPAAGERPPESPAPWGVTDGPYTKHYAKWLIPDGRFDGAGDDETIAVAGKGIFEGRATRGSLTDSTPLASKARPQRGSAGAKLQALSSGYPTARERAGPLIIKRSDGQYVKLVCLDCERGDFSSAQGFINHCRIAHHKSFESHDAAAMACGQVIDSDGISGGSTDSPTTGVTGLVHPLIRTAPTTPVPTNSRNSSWIKAAASGRLGNQTVTPNGSSKSSTVQLAERKKQDPIGPSSQAESLKETAAPDFVPSLQTPHLSALMKKKGFSGNLGEMVGEAAKKLEIGTYSSTEDEECWKEDIVTDAAATDGQQRKPRRAFSGFDGTCDEDESYVVGGRMPARAGMSPSRIMLGRPGSSKGLDKTGRKPGGLYTGTASLQSYQSTRINLSSKPPVVKHQEDEGVVLLDHPQVPIDLSPHASSASESLPNAPSLVSDDGDYAANSSDDSESPCSVADADDEDDVMDFGVEVGAYDDETTGCGSESTTTDADLTSLGDMGTPLGGRVNHTPGTKQKAVRKVKGVRGSRK
jgi:ADA HAT complex component 1